MNTKYEILMQSVRSNQVENEHYGLIGLYDEVGNSIKKYGNDNNYLFFHRSCMKPLQFAAITEVIDYYNFTDEEIGVCMASHAGDDIHLNAVRSILKKADVREEDLLCPPHAPLSASAQRKLILLNENPKSVHNNCSGKHASILAYCKMKGLDIKSYNDINHPVQKKILNFVSDICEYPIEKCAISKDNCTLPVLGTPLKNLATGFIKVFTSLKFERLRKAALSYPYHFGGEERQDTQIIIAGGGNLIAKVGAGNICCVVDISAKNCYVIKVADTDNFARGFVLTKVLKEQNKLPNYDKSLLPKLFPDKIKTDAGEIIGERNILFSF